MIGDVFRHNGAGADEGVAADCVATDDGAVGAERRAFLDEGGAHLIHLSDFGAGVVDVGEDHRGAAEDAIFQCYAFIDADVVLNFAFVAYDCVGADDNVLADVAVFADFGAGEDVGEVPDLGAGADGNVIVDDGGWMGEKTSPMFNVQSSRFYGRSAVFNGRRLF